MPLNAPFFLVLLFLLKTGRSATCPAGTFRKRNEGCVKCPLGKFQDKPGRDYCENCVFPSTTFSLGSTSCTKCPKKDEIPVKKGKCGKCPPGQSRPLKSTSDYAYGIPCVRCWPGFFKPDFGQQACEPCPKGSYSLFGEAQCTACPRGQVLIQKKEGKGRCGVCPAGKYLDDDRPECNGCLAGQFQPTPGLQRRCRKCPEGSFSRYGSTSCVTCPAGQVLLKRGCGACRPGSSYDRRFLECNECGLNTFTEGSNELRCRRCPKGSFSFKGAAGCTECPEGQVLLPGGECGTCPAGKSYEKYESRVCVRCSDGLFKKSAGQRGCRECPRGTRSNRRRTACV